MTRTRLHGALVLPKDAEYDEVRCIFNAMIDRRPAAIVRGADTNDVVTAVAFARHQRLSLSVRAWRWPRRRRSTLGVSIGHDECQSSRGNV